jgi:hypothetical protein
MKNGEMRRGPRSFDTLEATDAGADQHARRDLVVARLGVPVGVIQRLIGGGDRVNDEGIDLAAFLRLNPVVGIVLALGLRALRQRARDLAREIRDLEIRNARQAALARESI